MKLIPIDYQGGQIWVDKENGIKAGDTYYSTDYNYIKICIEVDNEFVQNALFYEKGCTVFDYSKDCFKVVAQSTNLSLPNIPYVEIEEIKSPYTEFPVPNQYWLEGYKAASAKKYTEEDMKKLYIGTVQNVGTSIKQCDMPTWEQVLQSLQPKVVSIEIETKQLFFTNGNSLEGIIASEGLQDTFIESPVTYNKDGKTFLKVKSIEYGHGRI